jgi:energy-coupling factor transport system substrate-specific component
MKTLRPAIKSHYILSAVTAVVIGSLANAFFQWLNADVLKWPFFFDSVFTIFVGIIFGWFPGVVTGLLSNILTEVFQNFEGIYYPFGIVNMATGLCAGLMARNKAVFWTLPRQILLILLLTIVNALLGSLVVIIVYGGLTGSRPDILVSALMLTGQGIFTSAFLARILLNLVDKGIPVVLFYSLYLIIARRREAAIETTGF